MPMIHVAPTGLSSATVSCLFGLFLFFSKKWCTDNIVHGDAEGRKRAARSNPAASNGVSESEQGCRRGPVARFRRLGEKCGNADWHGRPVEKTCKRPAGQRRQKMGLVVGPGTLLLEVHADTTAHLFFEVRSVSSVAIDFPQVCLTDHKHFVCTYVIVLAQTRCAVSSRRPGLLLARLVVENQLMSSFYILFYGYKCVCVV